MTASGASAAPPFPPHLHSRLSTLRIGSVRYLNARPLIEPYTRAGGHVRLEHPAILAAALAAGELDVALVPIYEALRSPQDRLVDGVAIAARGPVWSVYVAHQENDPAGICELALDPASLTSANLVQVLFKEWGHLPRLLPLSQASPHTARLLIGDQANTFRQTHGEGAEWSYLDLGEAWLRHTGYPFVFAAWVMRPDVPSPEQAADAFRNLSTLGRAEIESIAASDSHPAFALRYLTEHIRYDLGPEEKQGVNLFRTLLLKHGQLPAETAALPLQWV